MTLAVDIAIVAILVMALVTGLRTGLFSALGLLVGLVAGALAMPFVLPLVAQSVPDTAWRGTGQRGTGGINHVVHLRAEHAPDGFIQQPPLHPGVQRPEIAAAAANTVTEGAKARVERPMERRPGAGDAAVVDRRAGRTEDGHEGESEERDRVRRAVTHESAGK